MSDEFLQVNYKAVKDLLGISGKQLSNLLAKLATLNIIELQINPARQVYVKFTDKSILDNHLNTIFSKSRSAVPEKDLGDLAAYLQPPDAVLEIQTEERVDYFNLVKSIKSRYIINSENHYFKHFTSGHKAQFIRTFASRLEKGKITEDALDSAFKNFITYQNWSLSEVLQSLTMTCPNYKVFDAIMDFVWIQTEGKVAGASMEARGAKTLRDWVDSGITSLSEIEDCWLFMLTGEVNYNLSLISLTKALQQFQKFRALNSDGRFIYQKPIDNKRTSVYNNLLNSIENI